MFLAISQPARPRGACPTLRAPMQTGDGLLARLRISGGRLTPEQWYGIAGLAVEHGNGLVEITARGNLQVRGLTVASCDPFADAIEALVQIEEGLVVETPPFAGDDPFEQLDPRPLAQAIRHAARPLAHRLGPKVTVVVDGAGQVKLDGLKADIRLVATATGWTLAVGNGASIHVGAENAVGRVLATLEQLAELGPQARATDLAPGQYRRPAETFSPIGSFRLRDSTAIGVALPFGAATAASLQALAESAARHGVVDLRPGPHHTLFAIAAREAFAAEAEALGFIAGSSDPRLRISACIGSAGCGSGYVPARDVATSLAPMLPAKRSLHVSGCAKGCAHPRPADITLVGRPDGYGLVIGGLAGDTPRAILSAEQLGAAVAAAPGPR